MLARLCGVILCVCSLLVEAERRDIEIEMAAPVFILPQFTDYYSEREASIAPDEYETAERLKTLLTQGKSQEVLTELEEFYDLELSPAMLTLKAQIYFSLKMYPQAEKTYQAVLKRKPHLVRAHADLGQLYLLQEKFAAARESFAKAVSYGSNEAIIHGQLAYLNFTLYGPFTAISEYQQAMALEPDNTQWQQGLISVLSQANMYDAATALLQELLVKHPNDINLWLNQAALALRKDEPFAALSSLEMAIILGDTRVQNLKAAAQLHLQIHSYDRAFELLKQHVHASQLQMTTLSDYLRWMGQVGMWSQSDRLLDEVEPALARMSTDEQSLFYLHRAEVANALNHRDRANSFFQKALQQNPVNGPALLAYGDYLAASGAVTKAELLYIRAEAIKGNEQQALLSRAQLYIDQRDYEAALMHLRLAYQKFPELTDLKDSITVIENILRAQQSTQTTL